MIMKNKKKKKKKREVRAHQSIQRTGFVRHGTAIHQHKT